MTKKNDSNHLPTVGGLTNNVVIVQQQSLSEQPHQQQQHHHHHQQQHFVLPAMNNAAPMIITTPLGTIISCVCSSPLIVVNLSFSCTFDHNPTIAHNNESSTTNNRDDDEHTRGRQCRRCSATESGQSSGPRSTHLQPLQ
jgi:hypothetical protein